MLIVALGKEDESEPNMVNIDDIEEHWNAEGAELYAWAQQEAESFDEYRSSWETLGSSMLSTPIGTSHASVLG